MIDEELRTSAAHVVVGAAEFEDATVLDAVDTRHLARALRLRPGQVVTITDGAGRWRRCRWCPSTTTSRVLEPDGSVVCVPAAYPALTIGFVPVKGDRSEWIASKLTELGIDRIVVVRAARSVVHWEGERGAAHLERLRRVARESAMQARRCYVPEIVGVSAVADVSGSLAHFDGGEVCVDRPTVLIGPEGGWTEGELAEVPDRVSLGSLVLRAETAAVAAAVLLSHARSLAAVTQSGRESGLR